MAELEGRKLGEGRRAVGELCQPSSSCLSVREKEAQRQGALWLLPTGHLSYLTGTLPLTWKQRAGHNLPHCRLQAHLYLRLAMSSRKWPPPDLVQMLAVLRPKPHAVANGVH